MQKINNDLRYRIQFLDARYNNLWLVASSLTKENIV